MQSHMINFNKYMMPAIIETLAQRIALFNAASGGALTLTTAGFTGDFIQESFFKALHGAKRRVDRYGANTAVTPTDLEQIKKSGVKVAGGFGPIQYEPSQMTWLEKPTAQGIEVISRNFAEVLIADQLNTLIGALVAAISNQAEATNDVSATLGISYGAFNDAHAKFGDASASLVAQVMNGTAAHKLIGQNLTNTENLFKSESVNVITVLGRPIVVTDAPALYAAGTPNKLKVLSLTSGAGLVYDGGDVISNIETKNGGERIVTSMQADYTFGMAIKGYTWDDTSGGKSPTDAELFTGTNWDKVVGDIKHTAGVITIGDAAK